MHRPELGKRVPDTWIPLLFCLCVYGYTCIFNNVRIDDSYITASYARTLGTSGTWGMHPGFPSNAATSPLNVIVLAVLVRLGMSALTAQNVLNGILVLVIFATLLKLSRLLFSSDLWAYAGTALLFVNPLLVSTLGLETYLYLALLLLCCLAYFLRRFALAGFFCGLLILARPDGVLFVAILACFVVLRWRKSLLAFFAPAVALVASWELYSWRVLGSAVPDTYFIKRQQATWYGFHFANGWKLYHLKNPLPTDLSVIFLLALPLAILLAKNNRKWLTFCTLVGGATLLHALSYSALKVPPYHWYYAPECATLVLLGSAGLLYSWKEFSSRQWLAMATLALVTAASVGVGIVAIYRRHATPLTSNFGSASQYRAIALWINDHSSVGSYRLSGELGVIQYYSRAEAVSDFSDRQIVFSRMLDQPNRLPLWLRRANIRFLRLPNHPSGAVFSGDCIPGKRYDQTWTTQSPWNADHVWCWSDPTRQHFVSPTR